LQLQIKMNPKLYIRDPEQSELGRRIIKESIRMIYEVGFEDFTFKKLAKEVGSTEASIYRYFENKHRLLMYITAWFWVWMEYQLVFHTNNITDPVTKINVVFKLLTFQIDDIYTVEYIDKNMLYAIVIAEGNKSYLTKHVTEDNKDRLFKPYKDLCNRVAGVFLEYAPGYPYPHSLASTLLETAYHQYFFKDHLPSLTDFGHSEDLTHLLSFIENLVFSALRSFT
jgi:Bacterial regulatory proteins, tetR family